MLSNDQNDQPREKPYPDSTHMAKCVMWRVALVSGASTRPLALIRHADKDTRRGDSIEDLGASDCRHLLCCHVITEVHCLRGKGRHHMSPCVKALVRSRHPNAAGEQHPEPTCARGTSCALCDRVCKPCSEQHKEMKIEHEQKLYIEHFVCKI